MIGTEASPRLEDLASVGTRIRWGAILAGGMLALGLYFLLGILGAAVGLSISDRLSPTTLTTGAILWAIVTSCVALFVGGMVTSLFTVGENKVEAMLYGIIMWAVLFASFVGLGAAGVRTGFNAMVELSNTAQATTINSWETGAREAGASAKQIEALRSQLAGDTDSAAKAEQFKKTMMEASTRITWYAFVGMWLSMMAAAGGAVVGAGPTFRLIAMTTRGVIVTSRGPDERVAPIGHAQRGNSFPAAVEKV